MSAIRNPALTFLAAALLGLAGHGALTAARDGLATLLAAAESSGTEAAQPLIAARVAAGETLYGAWDGCPLDIAIYGPLTYAVPALAARALHLDGPGVWLAGRSVSLATGLFVLGMAAWILRRRRTRGWLILLAVLSLVPVLRLWNIAVTFRPDMPALALALAGVLLADRRRGKMPWSSLPLFLAALAFKPTALAGPLAVAAGLAFDGHRRGAARFAGLFGLLTAGYLLAMSLATGGNFLDHTVRVLDAPWSAAQAREVLASFLGILPPLVIPGLVLAVRFTGRRPTDLLGLTALISLALAAFFSGRTGADVNYFIEAVVYLVVLTFLQADGIIPRSDRAVPLGYPAAAAALLTVVCLLPFDRGVGSRPPYSQAPPLAATRRYFDDLTASLGTKAIFPGDLSLAVTAGLPHPYSDGFLVEYLVRRGKLTAGQVAACVDRTPWRYALLPDPMLAYRGIPLLPEAVYQGLTARFDFERARLVTPPGSGKKYLLLELRKNAGEPLS
jgi:hypothetical protein